MDLPFSPAADRNKSLILFELRRLLPPSANVLEIASGTGQHAQHFASACIGWRWQPTDGDAQSVQAIDARCRGLANVEPTVWLDVLHPPWVLPPQTMFNAIYCANLLHIAPWSTCPALMRGAAARLVSTGKLLLYGPYLRDGVATAASNQAFDADLRARDPRWGLRDLLAVEHEAQVVGLTLQEVVAMPANNLMVVFSAA